MNFRVKKTDEILQRDDRVALERQKTSLEGMVTAVNTLKESIEEKKQFAKGEDEEKVQKWAADVEAAVDEVDKPMRQLGHWDLRHETALFEQKHALHWRKINCSNSKRLSNALMRKN